MALALPYTLTAGTPEDVNQVQSNFDALATSFPLEHNSTNFSAVPQVRVTHNTTVTVTTTLTAIPWNTETFDSGTPSNNMHDTGSNTSRITCRVAGLYAIMACIPIQGAPGTDLQAQLYLNNTTVIDFASVEGNDSYINGLKLGTFYRLAVNDYVEVRASVGTATILMLDNANGNHFGAVMVSI